MIKRFSGKQWALTLTPTLLAFVYFYPRIILSVLGPDNPWTSFLYLYGFGVVFFSVGLLLILKTQACVLGRGYDTYWFYVLLSVMGLLMTLHGSWIYLSITMPYKGL